MRNLARRIIAAEHRAGDSADTEGRAAFRVCDKLRESLSGLVGTHGFRALLDRALTLSKPEAAWLAELEVAANGALVLPEELERELEPKAAATGGAALVAQVLDLLATFIGEALTERLAQQIWPKASSGESKPGGKK